MVSGGKEEEEEDAHEVEVDDSLQAFFSTTLHNTPLPHFLTLPLLFCFRLFLCILRFNDVFRSRVPDDMIPQEKLFELKMKGRMRRRQSSISEMIMGIDSSGRGSQEFKISDRASGVRKLISGLFNNDSNTAANGNRPDKLPSPRRNSLTGPPTKKEMRRNSLSGPPTKTGVHIQKVFPDIQKVFPEPAIREEDDEEEEDTEEKENEKEKAEGKERLGEK